MQEVRQRRYVIPRLQFPDRWLEIPAGWPMRDSCRHPWLSRLVSPNVRG